MVLLSDELGADSYLALITSNGTETLTMSAIDSDSSWQDRFYSLAEFQAYQVDMSEQKAKQWLKGELVVIALDKNATVTLATYVQMGAIIDAFYTQGLNDADEVSDLGATINNNQQGESATVSFKLWAPTAQTVSVQLFDDNMRAISDGNFAMEEDKNTGVWHVQTGEVARYSYYK